MIVLVLNAASSSQKSSLYRLEDSISNPPIQPLWSAHLDWTVADDKGILAVKSNGIREIQLNKHPIKV